MVINGTRRSSQSTNQKKSCMRETSVLGTFARLQVGMSFAVEPLPQAQVLETEGNYRHKDLTL